MISAPNRIRQRRPPAALILAVLVASLSAAACTDGSAVENDSTTTTEFAIEMEAVSVTFDDLDAMAAASDLIVEGSVVGVSDGRFQPHPTNEGEGDLALAIEIEVKSVLKGDAAVGDTVTVPWAGGFYVAPDLPRTPVVVVGQPQPEVGDHNVWFLGPHPDGGAVWGLVSYDGRLEVGSDGDLVLVGDGGSGAGREVAEMTLDQLRGVLEG